MTVIENNGASLPPKPDRQKKRRGKTPVVILLGILLAVFAWYVSRHGIAFDFHSFAQQLRRINSVHALFAVLLIYVGFFVRSFRWALFLRQHKKVSPVSLIGTQFIGFAAVGIFGRIADLSRPYLVAQKTELPISLQVAVYTIERMFDLGAAALIFSSALAFTPKDLPHHEIFVRVGIFSLAGTLFLAFFAISVRLSGVRIASLCGNVLGRFSPSLGSAVQSKILDFREGLNAISSVTDFVLTALMSLTLWLLIAFAYVQTTHAFVTEPTLAHLSFSRTMLLMGASIGGSLLQLPVLGWFTQIATTATAMHAFYGTPLEAATACGGLLLLVTFISVIPMGLLFARIGRVRFGDLRRDADATEEIA